MQPSSMGRGAPPGRSGPLPNARRGGLDATCDVGTRVLDAATQLDSNRVVSQLRVRLPTVADFLGRVTTALPAEAS